MFSKLADQQNRYRIDIYCIQQCKQIESKNMNRVFSQVPMQLCEKLSTPIEVLAAVT